MTNTLNISEFTHKTKINKNTILKHKHMCIINGNMYISDAFARDILSNYDLNNKWINTLYGVTFNYGFNFCHMCFTHIPEREIGKYKYSWRVTGKSGDFGFDDFYYNKKLRIDIRILYKLHKKLINIYLESKTARYDKIKKLLNEHNR